jgi:hypothetical protein
MQDAGMNNPDASRAALSALKRFARSAAPAEQCELCGRALDAAHPHLLEKQARRITCSCDACAVLFCSQDGGRYLRIPREVRKLDDFPLSELEWEELAIPIRLAFFFRTEEGTLAAMYPSPGGAIESQLSFGSLRARFDEHGELRGLRPLVEALLVSRVGDRHWYFITPIDECFRLVGLIRTRWHGLSGGAEVWGAISGFLQELEQRARPAREARHA